MVLRCTQFKIKLFAAAQDVCLPRYSKYNRVFAEMAETPSITVSHIHLRGHETYYRDRYSTPGSSAKPHTPHHIYVRKHKS